MAHKVKTYVDASESFRNVIFLKINNIRSWYVDVMCW
jgi:hypothetical protein